MLLQIFLASILTLNVGYAAESTEASNIESTKYKYELPNENKISTSETSKEKTNEKASRHLEPVNPLETKQQLPYITDNWSYQPFIEYGNVSPHSQSITQIALGKDAVEALRKSKESQQQNNNPQPNILYLQNEVAKPVDNQLPVQPEPNGNIVYVDPEKNQPNIYYLPELPPPYLNHHQNTQPPVLYYTPVPQQQHNHHHSQQHPDDVVFITPNPQQNNYNPNEYFNQPIQQNYYQPNHMYLVTHIQPVPSTKDQDKKDSDKDKENPKETENKDEKHKKEKEHEDKDKDHDKKKHEDEHVLVESSTAKAIIEEYERHYVKRRKNVDIKTDGESGTTHNPYPSATTPLSITTPAPLSRQPIIVADLDENNLEFDDKIYSTTQSTIKTVKTSATIYRPTQPIIVTPRPLGTTFLAPITAGVQLQSVQQPQKPKESVVVEIQKSVPYYLGKFEFIQNESPQETTKNEEIKQNVDLGASLLKYSLERLPNPETLISEYNNSGPVVYKTIHDQEQESGQFDYKVQNAPYQQILVNPEMEVTKLEKIYNTQQVQIQQVQHQQVVESEHPGRLRQFYVRPPAHIVSLPIKTVSDYIQKPSQIHQVQIPPIMQQQPYANQQPILLDPFPPVTRLIPQYVPLKHHQEVQKTPMKSYSYAPSYQPHNHSPHHQHNIQHNYQINHGHTNIKKQKSIPISYQPQPINNHNFYHTFKFNDYIGMKPPKDPNFNTNPNPSSTNANQGPPFKASQHLQTIHEYLPSTQLTHQQIRKYRNPRHSFGSGIRLEYGFMPPLIPSIEIDEFGKPIDKTEA